MHQRRLILFHSEDELDGDESELTHLRLRLRAIELLCYEFVPADADPELQQSIENWKADWADLKKKMASRKMEGNDASEADDSTVAGSTTASTFLESPRVC
jgi:hypothetical protein